MDEDRILFLSFDWVEIIRDGGKSGFSRVQGMETGLVSLRWTWRGGAVDSAFIRQSEWPY